jgi:hypothetical protein
MRRSCIAPSEDSQLRSKHTIAEVQPRDILTASELTKVRDFLRDADMLVTEVKSLFFNTGDAATAARLKDIQGRLADEIHAVERLIVASKPTARHPATPHAADQYI